MQEGPPDIARAVCVRDGLGNPVTGWFHLREGVSCGSAAKVLENALSNVGERMPSDKEGKELASGVLTVAEAATRLRDKGMKVSADTIRLGLQQRVFPFGDCIRTGDDNTRCYVYEKLLNQWIQTRFDAETVQTLDSTA